MPYIGNTSPSRFVSNRAATQFSGDGSTTAFTLEQAVVQDEDIIVSVDGVIQEPSVAYAVSNGTTLTFTGAPSSNSGNNIFVYYLASQVGTVGHPSNQALSATTGTFTGNVVIPDAGNIGSASDTDAIAIASGGAVTFSQSPIGTGMDRLLSNTTTSAASSVDISNTYINSTYDTYLIIFRITPSGDNVNLNVLFATDGSTFQTGNIYGIKSYRLGEDAGATGFDAGGGWTINSNTIGNDTGESINGYFYLVAANNTAAVSGIHGLCSHINTSGNHRSSAFSGSQITSARDGVVNGLRFSMSTGNIENSEITIYGLDKN